MNPVSNFRSDPNGSSNAQDILEKRRRQIEKVRAANIPDPSHNLAFSQLSKQLQVRLRYARLKVDHGWQKQTLNEVENLYFHHYRGKAPSVSDPHPTSKPKKPQSREKVHASPKADKDGNATASGPSGSNITMTPVSSINNSQTLASIEDHPPSVTQPHPFAAGRAISNTNPASSTSVLSTETDPGMEATVIEPSTQSFETQNQSKELSLPGPSSTSLGSLSPTLGSEPPPSLNTLESGTIPASSTTQIQNSIAVTSTSTSHPTASSSFAIPSSPSSGSTTAHSSQTRAPSKLPIPRLPAVSYPYTGVTSPASLGKARKTTQLSAGLTASRYSAPSPSPSIASIPLLSPYKSPYTSSSHAFSSSSSTSTALQTAPSSSSLSANSSENASLPLTYDSFWSSHTSSSSLPSSYRSNLTINSPFAFSPSSSTLPTTSSTASASSAPSTSTSLTAASTSSFSFTSYPSPSAISSLSHSPMVPSLLHSQGLALFQQAVHSPPTVGASNQNATVG